VAAAVWGPRRELDEASDVSEHDQADHPEVAVLLVPEKARSLGEGSQTDPSMRDVWLLVE
jgi:hypothetical protein